MEISCNVIRDLLPLYAEDMVSQDSRALIERHMVECPECGSELKALREPVALPPETNPQHLKKIGKRMAQRVILLVMVMIFVVSTVMTWTFAVLALRAVPVDLEDTVLGIVEEDGKVCVEIRVSGYLSWWEERDSQTPSPWNTAEPEIGNEITCLSVNRKLWDVLFSQELPDYIIKIPVGDASSVWYFTGSEAQCILGDESLRPGLTVDPVFWTALSAMVLCLLLYWPTKWKWLRTGALFSVNLILADFVITGCMWKEYWGSSIGIVWTVFLIMALLLTCSEVFAYHLWKERNII